MRMINALIIVSNSIQKLQCNIDVNKLTWMRSMAGINMAGIHNIAVCIKSDCVTPT